MYRNSRSFGCVFVFVVVLCGLHSQGYARRGGFDNPFTEIDELAKSIDTSDPQAVWDLIHTARREKLYGTARVWARKLVEIDPDHRKARKLLGHELYKDRDAGTEEWLTEFSADMRKKGYFRHPEYGWWPQEERESIENGKFPVGRRREYVSLEELDQAHAGWKNAREIETRFFEIRSTLPLKILRFIVEDIEAFVLSYMDHFEVKDFPKKKMKAHLYRELEDVEKEGADVERLRRGAYYENGIVHLVVYNSGRLMTFRHETGHALNDVYGLGLPQWLEEGIGAYCQFASALDDGRYEFIYDMSHPFCNTVVMQIQQGEEKSLKEIASTPRLAQINAEYYSAFRSIVDFCMNAENRKYRMTFLKALFHRGGSPSLHRICGGEDLQEAWIAYLKQRKPQPYRLLNDDRATRAYFIFQ